MVIDERAGAAELQQLAEALAAPCQLDGLVLEGLVARTATALIFVAHGGRFGTEEGILKLTGSAYAPLLERELHLLDACRTAGLHGVVQPVHSALEWYTVGEGDDGTRCAALLLPFLAGGDLVQWMGAQATRTGQLGVGPALEVGEIVGGLLRGMLLLPRPIVHGDVKPQNVLLPHVDAPLTDLTLIDLDASDELETALEDPGMPAEVARRLMIDVNGFGELLFVLATGREPPSESAPCPATANAAFDALVVKCLLSDAAHPGYASMADDSLWHDLERAQVDERSRVRRELLPRILLGRPVLAMVAVILFCLLLVTVVSKLIARG